MRSARPRPHRIASPRETARPRRPARALARATAGFSLIELIIAVGILSVMASVTLPLLTTFEDRKRRAATEDELDRLDEALVSYFEDHGAYPSDVAALEAAGYLPGRPGPGSWDTDGWGETYQFARTATTASVASARAGVAIALDATPVLRRATRNEMATIRTALRNYEQMRSGGGEPDLPGHWDVAFATDGALRMLVARGLLSEEARYLADAWGGGYTYGGSPSTIVQSPTVASPWPDDAP